MPERASSSARVTAALRYTGDGAPTVVAAGRGIVAATILEKARDAGVPVHKDPELADALAGLCARPGGARGAVGRGRGGARMGVLGQ